MAIDEARRLVTFLVLAAGLLVPLEQLRPRVRGAGTWRSFAVDVAWLAAGALTLTFVVAPLLATLLETLLETRAREQRPDTWRLALAFAGAEVGAYVSHRSMHTVPLLWRFHAVHHAPGDLTWSRAWRQHPVDVALHAMLVALPGVLLGVSLAQFAALLLVRRLWTGFLHANVDVRFGVLEHVIATPAFHHAHHSDDPTRFNSNYASLLPVLDRAFGTWQPPEATHQAPHQASVTPVSGAARARTTISDAPHPQP